MKFHIAISAMIGLLYIMISPVSTCEAACNNPVGLEVDLAVSGPRHIGVSSSVTNTYSLRMTYAISGNELAESEYNDGTFSWEYNTNQLAAVGTTTAPDIMLLAITTNTSSLVETARIKCFYNNPLWSSDIGDCVGSLTVNIYKVGIQYNGGADADNAASEEVASLDNEFFMPGYMLKLMVMSNVTSDVTWNVTRNGTSNGTYHPNFSWQGYRIQSTTIPTAAAVNWRSSSTDAIPSTYRIEATFTPSGASAAVTTTRTIQSRILNATTTALSSRFNEDVDMLQRALIQVFYLNKGRLDSYRIGQYDKGSTAGYYHANDGRNVANWSSVADEAWNFNKFALNTATDVNICPVTSSTVQGIWTQFQGILQGAAQITSLAGNITTNHASFTQWQNTATPDLGSIPVTNVTATALINAVIRQESSGTHSYPRIDPLAACSVQVGENALSGHTFTDGGLGFCKVQPYNHANYNLYRPDHNMRRSAQMLQGYINGVDENEVNAQSDERKLWYAVFRYNNGSYGGYQSNTSGVAARPHFAGKSKECGLCGCYFCNTWPAQTMNRGNIT